MNKCKIIKDITNEIIKGGNAEELIPYDIRMLDDDGKAEMLMLYIKYGKNPDRISQCKRVLKELEL